MIQLFRPVIDTESALTKLRGVFESGWLGPGSLVEQLEQEMQPFTNQRYFVATSSGTAALQLAVRALNLPRGSRFLTTPITFVSTNAALLWEEMTPVFGDVGETGLLLSDLEKCHAVMYVRLGGVGGLMEADVPVIEDCAHALGADLPPTDNLRCWSFNEKKALPVGLGGGVSTNSRYIAERIRRLRWLGITKSTHERTGSAGYDPTYDIPELGIKADMNDVQAAIGLAMLPRVREQVERRQEIAARYCKAFEQPIAFGAAHFLPLMFKDRDRVRAACTVAGIQTGLHYQRCDLLPPFRDCPKIGRLDGAEYYVQHQLTLPLHCALTDNDVEHVISVVKSAM